MADRWLR